MSAETGNFPEHDEFLLDTVLSYLEEVDAGRAPDMRAVLARHPGLEGELTVFFADQDRISELLAPLRTSAPGSPATREESGQGQVTTGPYQQDERLDTAGMSSGPCAPLPSIPGYEVQGLLGQGGMGIVYKARHMELNRLAAIKMIRSQRLADDRVRARFRTEARAVAQFDHPNLVRVYEYGEAAGQPYFALEFVSGGSLAERCNDGPLPPRSAAALVAHLADAVEYAHRRGILHRDLKPANVLLTADGVPKITDFGLAKDLRDTAADLTGPEAFVGTPAYFAPEQAGGRTESIGPSADVFGLGGILYCLLTGRPPFQGKALAEVVEQAREGRVQPPRQLNSRVPRSLERICLKALAADPGQRYPSAAALGDDLRRYLRRPRLIALAAGVLAIFLLAGVFVRWFPRTAEETAAPLSGELIVSVWSPDGVTKYGLKVGEPGSLPVRNEERLRAEARLNQPAHVYLLWIDSEGVVTPLYPWNTGSRIVHKSLAAAPPEHSPQSVVQSPGAADAGWRVLGKSGLDTILLLARRTPLRADSRLDEVVGPLTPTRAHNPREWAIRGFDSGQEIRFLNLGDNRAPDEEAARIDDPLLRLMGKLGEYFETIRAVRFAHEE
jgi:serine/threonine-protein kinase